MARKIQTIETLRQELSGILRERLGNTDIPTRQASTYYGTVLFPYIIALRTQAKRFYETRDRKDGTALEKLLRKYPKPPRAVKALLRHNPSEGAESRFRFSRGQYPAGTHNIHVETTKSSPTDDVDSTLADFSERLKLLDTKLQSLGIEPNQIRDHRTLDNIHISYADRKMEIDQAIAAIVALIQKQGRSQSPG